MSCVPNGPPQTMEKMILKKPCHTKSMTSTNPKKTLIQVVQPKLI